MDLLNEIVKNHENGATINLFVTPGAENNFFPVCLNKWRKRIEIKVAAEAKENKANLEVIKLIARFYNKPIRNVKIIKGKKSKEKTVLIKDISESKTIKKLRESFNGL